MSKYNARILSKNVHDTATLTATSEALPITNTQRSERARAWRSVGLSEQMIEGTLIEGTLIAGAYIDCVSLARHNFGAEGLWRVELIYQGDVIYDSGLMSTALLIPAGIWRAGIDAWGASYNDQLTGISPVAILWLDKPFLITGYRITLGGIPQDNFMEVGRVFVGQSFSPSVNFNWGVSVEWQESGEHIATEAGSLRTIGCTDELRRKFGIQLDWLNDADRTQLVTQMVRAGLGADLLVALYVNGSEMLQLEHTMVCRRELSVGHNHSHYLNWKSQLSFIEV